MKKMLFLLLLTVTQSVIISAQTDIRKIDFQNFTYQPFCAGDETNDVYATIKVTGGTIKNVKLVGDEYQQIDENLPNYFDVEKPIYGDIDGDGKDEAIITSVCNTGGTGQFDEGYIYTLKKGKPVLLTRFQGGDRGFGGIVSVKFEKGSLVVERNDSVGGANCCAEFTLTDHYKWNGGKLVAVGKSVRRELHPAERVTFAAGKSSVEIVLKLSNSPDGSTKRFVIKARSGQILTVAADSKDVGVALISGEAEEKTEGNIWTAKLSATGDYKFEVGNNTVQTLTARIKISVQ